MGYVEKVMGDNERAIYSTHQHPIVLLQEVFSSLFAFLVFLVMGLIALLPATGKDTRFYVGLITLGSAILPIYQITAAWLKGLRGREFARRIWRPALIAVFILVLALTLMLRPDIGETGWILLAIAVFPAVEVVRIVLDWLNERYLITNRRVMEVKGIINKHVRDSALEKVNDVELDQSIVGRLMRYGTVQIITGSDIGINMFRRISNPVRFKREMLNAKEGLKTTIEPKATDATVPAAESAPPGPDTAASRIPDLIAELDELRQRGIISKEEFESKKRELLGRL